MKMFNNLFFCNNWHNGDLHYSREIIKDIIEKVPSKNYILAYNSSSANHKGLKDIKNLQSIEFNNEHLEKELIKIQNNNLYINIWAGVPLYSSHKYFRDNKRPQFYADLTNLYDIVTALYDVLKIKIEDKKFYIPEIDYSVIEKHTKDNIHKVINNNRTKILISNGSVLSGQSNNFNMNELILALSINLSNIDFILTDDSNKLNRPNIFYTKDIIKINGCDLLEISYISTFCDFIIGRGSGPYCFCITKNNVKYKKFIGIGIKEPDTMWCDIDNKLFINNRMQLFNSIYNYIKMNL